MTTHSYLSGKTALGLIMATIIVVLYLIEYQPQKQQIHLQSTFGTRRQELDEFLIPTKTALNNLSNDELLKLYDRYNNDIQVLCHHQKKLGDETNGKYVCFDETIKPKLPCLVYSFGSQNEFEFEDGVKRHLQCETHTFDPSMTKLKPSQIHAPAGVTFHHYGLSNVDGRNKRGYNLKTLGTIRHMLNHTETFIDILKIDIEGDEWNSLEEMVKTGMFKNIKQLLVEFHFWKLDKKTRARWLYVFRLLFKAGLRKFSRERLWKWMPEAQYAQYQNTSERDVVALQVEMSFLNINV